MDELINNIDKQLVFNQNKNILFEDIEIFQFSDETVKAISEIGFLNAESKQILIDYTTDKAIEVFCKANQYYSFNSHAKNELRKIYTYLFESFSSKTHSIDDISKAHYERIKEWLKETNPFLEKIYSKTEKIIKPVVCSEYGIDLQLELLQINVAHLKQPVLDIGCGKNGYLVNYLLNHNIEVLGMDRMPFSSPNFESADWLEFQYISNTWGTIISNLGFSNHFNHHHLREDGQYIEYAKTYMKILYSLKVGGKFHYAPDLPFIEKYLNKDEFAVEKYEITESDYKTTIVIRLK